MRLSRPMKLFVLLFTVLPLVYMVFFMASAFSSVAGQHTDSIIFDNFEFFMVVHLTVMLVMFALLVFYIVFLFKTDRVKPEMKALWGVVLFLGSFVAMPIFWFLYIWPESQNSGEPA